MPRQYVDHACESCGAVRSVRLDKLEKGLQRTCRKCQGKASAEKRKASMLRRGDKKRVEYWLCKECSSEYQVRMDDDGFCSDECRAKSKSRGCSMGALRRAFLTGRPITPLLTKKQGIMKQLELLDF